jgi:hypothetical protein
MTSELEQFSTAVFGLKSGFFHLPMAQARSWRSPDDKVDALRDLLAIGHVHFAFHDLVIDEQQALPAMCVIADTSLLLYLDGLAALVPSAGDRYRRQHDRYYRDYAAAIARDLAHRGRPRPYSVADVLGLGAKAAPGLTAMHVAADLAGVPELGEPTAQALLRLCTGLQLLDDLDDLDEDAATGNNTWPLTTALLAYPDVDVADATDLRAAVVASGAAHACLDIAERAFRDAATMARAAKASVLEELANVWRWRTFDRRSIVLNGVAAR